MTFEEYRSYDALGLASLVKKGEVSPDTLLQLAIDRIEAVNPKINAVIHRMYDDARAQIAALPADSPFKGVPFLIKDLGVDIKGHPHRHGCRGYEKKVSDFDSYVTTKMRKAGLLLMGKTNTPEFGLSPYTEPVSQGPSLNPWNTAHTTGGSSGGSGAAVAAGIVPMATANDGGGSIRIPASCNGLFGLKPSRGRVSIGPAVSDSWNGAVVEGCVSRTVRDSAAYLDAISGPMPGDPYFLPAPERPYLAELNQAPRRLKIGFTLETQ